MLFAGQDGSYLAEFLLMKGYIVYGILRRSSSFNTGRIEHLYQDRHGQAVRLVEMPPSLSFVTQLRKFARVCAFGDGAVENAKVVWAGPVPTCAHACGGEGTAPVRGEETASGRPAGATAKKGGLRDHGSETTAGARSSLRRHGSNDLLLAGCMLCAFVVDLPLKSLCA